MVYLDVIDPSLFYNKQASEACREGTQFRQRIAHTYQNALKSLGKGQLPLLGMST